MSGTDEALVDEALADGDVVRMVLRTSLEGGEAPPVDVVAEAREQGRQLAGQVGRLALALRLSAAGDTVSEDAGALQRQLAGNVSGEQAQAIVGALRECVGRALDGQGAEDKRRGDALNGAYDAMSKAGVVDGAAREGLPMLANAGGHRTALQAGADAIVAAKHDRGLALMGSPAAEFDIAVLGANAAATQLSDAAKAAQDDVAAEKRRRGDVTNELDAKAKETVDALGAAVAKVEELWAPAQGAADPEKAKTAAENRKKQLLAALTKAVPGWTGRDEVAVRLGGGLPDARAPHAEWDVAETARRESCTAGSALAMAVSSWADGFKGVQALGAATVKKGTELGKVDADVKANLETAMRQATVAIGASDFEAARTQLDRMSGTVDALARAKERAGADKDAGIFVLHEMKRITGLLKEAEKAAAAPEQADGLLERFDRAEQAQGGLKDANEWLKRDKGKLRGKLVPVGNKVEALTTGELVTRSVGQLVAGGDALERAEAFRASAPKLGALETAQGEANAAASWFQLRDKAQATVFYNEINAITDKADPLADPGFRNAIQALKDQAIRIGQAQARREQDVKVADEIGKQIEAQFGADTPVTKGLATRLGAIAPGSEGAAARFEGVRGLMRGVANANTKLKEAWSSGEDALTNKMLGRTARLKLQTAAQMAIAKQIQTGAGELPGEIATLQTGQQNLVAYEGALKGARVALDDAGKVSHPEEFAAELRRRVEAARVSADALEPEAQGLLSHAKDLAEVINASAPQFRILRDLAKHGMAAQKTMAGTTAPEGVTKGLSWTAGGAEYARWLEGQTGDLKKEQAAAYAEHRKGSDPATAKQQHTDLVALFATLEGGPTPPEDPGALMRKIDQAATRSLSDAVGTLGQSYAPVEKELARLHTLLPDIKKFQADWATMETDYNTAVADLFPEAPADLAALKAAAVADRLMDPKKGQVALQALDARVKALTKKRKGWRDPVPTTIAGTRPANYATAADATAAAEALLADGGLTHDAIASLIPVNGGPGGAAVPESYGYSPDYPTGFKYQWNTANGKQVTIYGHKASHGPLVLPTAISGKGNIVRIMVDGEYLQSDGTTTTSSATDKGHIPLLGNP